MNISKVTRLEVIDDVTGRLLTLWPIKELTLSLQDDGRTLKVFVTSVPKETA